MRTPPLCNHLFGKLDDKLKRYDPLYIARRMVPSACWPSPNW
ncbi:MAG: hypothetical protein U1F42_02990 [Candidatus Competibacteraceae bacterium]